MSTQQRTDEAALGAGALGRINRGAVRYWLRRVGILPILIVVLLIVFGTTSTHYLTASNISNVLTQSVYLIIVTVAQTLVLLTGGFDLSVGSSIALVSVGTSFTLLNYPNQPLLAIVMGLLVGVALAAGVGVLNGATISLFKVSPFIVTLATLSIISGITLIISGGVPVFGLPGQFASALFTSSVVGVPVPWIVTAAILIIMYGVLHWTRLGRYWYAIGGNAEAARLSGVSVRRYTFLAYLATGILVGVAAVLLTARVGSGEPTLGAEYPLESIAAAVLGGVSIRGGEGTLLGAVLGAIVLVFLRNGMDVMGVNSYIQSVVTGALLIIAIVFDRYIHSNSR